MRVFLDSCIIIYAIESSGPEAERAWRWMSHAQQSGYEISVSELVRLECLVGPIRRGDDVLVALYDSFLTPLGPSALDRATCELAARLRAQHRFKTPDALNLACAILAGCAEFWTNDARLEVEGLGIKVVPLP